MSDVLPKYDAEIDLIKFSEILWDSKWLISGFIAIALLLGSGFLLKKDPVYESKLIYSVGTIPPIYNANNVLNDFHNKFYSVSVFEKWKQENRNTSLVFGDFSDTEVVDGFLFSKNKDKQLATLHKTKDSSFILVNSKQLPVLEDFFKYAIHISGLLKDDYISISKEELKAVEIYFEDLKKVDKDIVNTVLSIDRFIRTAEKGASVISIKRPSIPKKVSPKVLPILAFSVFLGGMAGVIYVLILNAIRKRKEHFANR